MTNAIYLYSIIYYTIGSVLVSDKMYQSLKNNLLQNHKNVIKIYTLNIYIFSIDYKEIFIFEFSHLCSFYGIYCFNGELFKKSWQKGNLNNSNMSVLFLLLTAYIFHVYVSNRFSLNCSIRISVPTLFIHFFRIIITDQDDKQVF